MNIAYTVACSAALALAACAADPLQQVQTIPLPDVSGRIDHFAINISAQRLFVAALGNDTVEFLDLRAGKRTTTLRDLAGIIESIGTPTVQDGELLRYDAAANAWKPFRGATEYVVIGEMRPHLVNGVYTEQT
jgi:hypothetical protein